jgi:hypothetical protein
MDLRVHEQPRKTFVGQAFGPAAGFRSAPGFTPAGSLFSSPAGFAEPGIA